MWPESLIWKLFPLNMGLLTSGGVLAKRHRGAYGKKKIQENTFFMIDFQRGSNISESVRIAPKGLQRAVLEFEEGRQNVATDPLTLEHTNQGRDSQQMGRHWANSYRFFQTQAQASTD